MTKLEQLELLLPTIKNIVIKAKCNNMLKTYNISSIYLYLSGAYDGLRVCRDKDTILQILNLLK